MKREPTANLAKLAVPMTDEIIERPRLHEDLDEALAAPVICGYKRAPERLHWLLITFASGGFHAFGIGSDRTMPTLPRCSTSSGSRRSNR